MALVTIPEGISEEELEGLANALRVPKEEKQNRPRGWKAYWQKHAPKVPYDPPPIITTAELKAFREEKGWFQKHLAIRTGYSTNTIKNMELGFANISPMLSSMVRLMMENDELRKTLEERDKKLALLGHAPAPKITPRPQEAS